MADSLAAVPKLYYFNMKGRAEIVRLVFATAGLKFEDCRVSKEEWPTHKSKAPFLQMPYLDINGQCYGQSVALAMYAAREGGLYGDTNLECLKIDQVIQLIQDLIIVISRFYNEKDPEKLEGLSTTFKKTDGPRFYRFFENIIKDTGTGYVVGNKLTLADIAIYEVIKSGQIDKLLKSIMPSLDAYPMIEAVVQKVASNPNVKAYVESCPDSEQ